MTKFIAILCLIGLAGCSTKEPKVLQEPVMYPFGLVYPSSETKEQSDRRLAHEKRVSDKYKADYAAKYREFRCEENEVPAAKIFELDTGQVKPVMLPDALQLCLRLGKATPIESERLVFRTESRYVLKNASGKELARGESMITGPNQGSSRVIYCAASRSMLLDETLSGAGDISRRIAFVPDSEEKIQGMEGAETWRAFYVYVPLRQDTGEGHIGHILSISNGKFYVETDGVFYAFPIKDFVESKLEFSVG
jgi:hypothetical protein